MNSLDQAEDLKAFERRLTEYIACLQPATGRWRMILIVVSVCTASGAWNWLIDPETQKVSFFISFRNHTLLTIRCITLISLFFAGIHRRVVAPSMHSSIVFVRLKVLQLLQLLTPTLILLFFGFYLFCVPALAPFLDTVHAV
ncbi:nuclear envelope phosphatase-regulatory subunit 1 [Pezoporus wallicus]|uniref:nuclear envelope phosphatase-regulatory subunit 1 n=1 Tax=Pezoporus wallicus TaxID=35540 RepID=UPI00254E0945|nr:nuclear envelope phosphatase-regulatory subunit 1 [Pezoporus wallicus]